MKYRITTNGILWRVQSKSFLFWKTRHQTRHGIEQARQLLIEIRRLDRQREEIIQSDRAPFWEVERI